MVLPTFFNLSLNFAKEAHKLTHSQHQALFFLTLVSFLIFASKEYNQSDFGIDHLVMSMCRVFSCVVERGCLLWPQAGIKIAGRNINNLRYADDTTLMAENEEELKSLLMKVKVESEKVGLKLKHSEN